MKAKDSKVKKEKTKKPILTKTARFTIMAVILIIIFSVALTPVTLQNDTFYSIKVGDHISTNGIDMKDAFSWHENLPYTYPHWLYDLWTFIIFAFFGLKGIFITTCILSAVLGVSLFFVMKNTSKSSIISFIITIAAMYVLRTYITARAQLVTFILFVWTFYFIEKFIETRKWTYIPFLVIISVLIANLHVAVWPFYFILYLPYIAEYILNIIIDTVLYNKVKIAILRFRIKRLEKLKSKQKNIREEKLNKLKILLKDQEIDASKVKIKRDESRRKPYKIKITKNDSVKFLILVFIICLLTGLITPLGTTPYTYLYKTMQGNTPKNINEHLPMVLTESTEALCMLVIFIAIITFTKTKIRLSDLFFLGGLTYLMLSSKRQIAIFTIIMAIILSRLIVSMIKEYNIDTTKIQKFCVTTLAEVFVIALVGFMSYKIVKPKLNSKFVNESSYPVAACTYITQNIDLEHAKFYNEYNYGSYMIFRGIPVFIDARADLYAPEFNGKEDIFMDFINTSAISTFYEDTFEKYGITHVITYKNSKMNMIIKKTKDSRYKQLYEDNHFTIYERVKPEGEDQENAENTEQTNETEQTEQVEQTEQTEQPQQAEQIPETEQVKADS